MQPWSETDEKAPRKAFKIEEVIAHDEVRMQLPDSELNRVLGGGLVPGSVTLVAGEPGIGKSTLFLQCALQWKKATTLYVSGEESAQQVKLRAERIGAKNSQLYILNATNTDTIFSEIKKIKPGLVIIDSIQTLESPYVESAAGSVSQVRESRRGAAAICQDGECAGHHHWPYHKGRLHSGAESAGAHGRYGIAV